MVRKARARMTPGAQGIQPTAPVFEGSPSKVPGVQRDSTHGIRNSGPGNNSPEDSIESLGSPGKEAGYKLDLKSRKRPRLASPREEAMRRSKRQALYTCETTSEPEQEPAHPRGESDYIGSPTYPKHLDADLRDTEEENASYWPENAAGPRQFGSNPSAGLGTSSAAVPGGNRFISQTPHTSQKLTFGNENIKVNTVTGLPVGLARDRAKAAWPKSARLNPGLVQTGASQASASNVKQEVNDGGEAKQPPESGTKVQESKLIQNMQYMQEVVESLSLLLQVGQHAIGAHENKYDADGPNPGNDSLVLEIQANGS